MAVSVLGKKLMSDWINPDSPCGEKRTIRTKRMPINRGQRSVILLRKFWK